MCASLSETRFIYLSISNEMNTPDGMFHVTIGHVSRVHLWSRPQTLEKGGALPKKKQNKQGKGSGTNCLSQSNMTNQNSSLSVEPVGNDWWSDWWLSAFVTTKSHPLPPTLSPQKTLTDPVILAPTENEPDATFKDESARFETENLTNSADFHS